MVNHETFYELGHAVKRLPYYVVFAVMERYLTNLIDVIDLIEHTLQVGPTPAKSLPAISRM